MKIKKVAALVQKAKRVVIMEKPIPGGVRQYLSNGYAAYPIHGLPRLGKENLLTIFDVDPADWDKWHVSVREIPAALNFGDTDDGEYRTELAVPVFFQNGETIMPFCTEDNGVVFLNEKYLGPVSDGVTEFYLREDRRGKLFFAIKSGLYLRAVIMPQAVVCGSFADRMREFLFRCNKELVSPSGTTIQMDRDKMPQGKTVEDEDNERPASE